MKVAVLGPICKDYIKVDNNLRLQMGGIPFYISHVLENLGVRIVAFITFNEKDKNWVTNNFKGIKLVHIPAQGTLEFYREYSSKDPDVCTSIKIKHHPNIIKAENLLIKNLENFDYIILSPLFHDNIPLELFEKLKHKKLITGNFGMFTYSENGEFIQKNPENLIKILPYLEYLFLDINESRFISGKKSAIDSGSFFQEHGLENMIITDGSKGSHLFIGNNHYQIPAYAPKKIIDPTGAGDTYLAAYLKAIDLFESPWERGKFAAMVATISLERSGAFDKDLDYVMSRLRSIDKKN